MPLPFSVPVFIIKDPSLALKFLRLPSALHKGLELPIWGWGREVFWGHTL